MFLDLSLSLSLIFLSLSHPNMTQYGLSVCIYICVELVVLCIYDDMSVSSLFYVCTRMSVHVYSLVYHTVLHSEKRTSKTFDAWSSDSRGPELVEMRTRGPCNHGPWALATPSQGPRTHPSHLVGMACTKRQWSEVTCSSCAMCCVNFSHTMSHAPLSLLSKPNTRTIPCTIVPSAKGQLIHHHLSSQKVCGSCTLVRGTIDFASVLLMQVVPLLEPELSPPLHEVVMQFPHR